MIVTLVQRRSMLQTMRIHHRKYPDHLKVLPCDYNINLSKTANNTKRNCMPHFFSLTDAAKRNQESLLPTFYSSDNNRKLPDSATIILTYQSQQTTLRDNCMPHFKELFKK